MIGTKTISYFNFQKSKIVIEFIRGQIHTDGSKSRKFFEIDDPKGISIENKWTYKSGVEGGGYKILFGKDVDIEYIMF